MHGKKENIIAEIKDLLHKKIYYLSYIINTINMEELYYIFNKINFS